MYGQGGGRPRSFGGPSTAPVRVGEELDVKIEAVGEKGDGIAKKNGFVLFVPGAQAGAEVKIRVTKVLRKVGFAEIVGSSSGGTSEKKEESSEEEPAASSEDNAEEDSQEESSEDSENFGEDDNQR